jgi:hypothetical protein
MSTTPATSRSAHSRICLFENADLFDAFVKMPNTGGYAFPYSYKPAKAAKTHVANENFNPDFFVKVVGTPRHPGRRGESRRR